MIFIAGFIVGIMIGGIPYFHSRGELETVADFVNLAIPICMGLSILIFSH